MGQICFRTFEFNILCNSDPRVSTNCIKHFDDAWHIFWCVCVYILITIPEILLNLNDENLLLGFCEVISPWHSQSKCQLLVLQHSLMVSAYNCWHIHACRNLSVNYVRYSIAWKLVIASTSIHSNNLSWLTVLRYIIFCTRV